MRVVRLTPLTGPKDSVQRRMRFSLREGGKFERSGVGEGRKREWPKINLDGIW